MSRPSKRRACARSMKAKRSSSTFSPTSVATRPPIFRRSERNGPGRLDEKSSGRFRSRKDCFMSETKASRQRDAVARTARSVAQVWEDRTALVKQEVAAESAANDAKTARLRAL